MSEPKTRKPLTKHSIAGILIGILVAVGVVALALHRADTAPVQKGRHFNSGDPVPVAVAIAQKTDVPVIKQELGTVTPLTNVTVRTQISGYLTNVDFQEGQIVKKDDLLAEIDVRPYQLALENAQGAYLRDQALLKEAQLNLQRYKVLVAQDSIAKQTLDTQDSLVSQYIGTLQTDQAAIDQAKLNLAYCHITSPVVGRIGLRQVDVGNYAQTSDTNGIVVITQLQPITVIFTVAEDDLPAVMKRVNEGGELQATAYDRTHTNKIAVGKLTAIDNEIDVTTGTVKLRAQFDNNDNMLFPNQFVNIDLLVDTLPGTTTVPSSAIQRGAPGTFVYLVKDDNTVTVRPVKLGPDEGISASVLDGLNPGDKVVTDGLDKLREGSKITIPSEKKKKKSAKATTDPSTDAQADAAKAGDAKMDGKNDAKPDTKPQDAATAAPSPASPALGAASTSDPASGAPTPAAVLPAAPVPQMTPTSGTTAPQMTPADGPASPQMTPAPATDSGDSAAPSDPGGKENGNDDDGVKKKHRHKKDN